MTQLAGLPATLHRQVQRLCDDLVTVLGHEIAVVVHGSVALGDFQSDQSDLDVLVFGAGQPDGAQMRQLAQVVLAVSGCPAPLEISLLDVATLAAWVHPAPFYFHFSEHWRTLVQTALTDPAHDWLVVRHDPDLTAHLMVAHRHGLLVYGRCTLPEPTAADAMAAVWYDIAAAPEQVVDEPVYVILNLCRTLHWLRSGVVLSKGAGGRAILPELTGETRQVVATVLAMRDGHTTPLPQVDALRRAAQHLLDAIERLHPPRVD
jgi:streptomycin 3"-adenylyltransferase